MTTQLRQITFSEWQAEGAARFGSDRAAWAFVCPSCGHSQTVAELRGAGVPESAFGFSCIGRWLPKASDALSGRSGPCTYAGGGLFRLNPVTVLTPDGKTHQVFEWAEPTPVATAPALSPTPALSLTQPWAWAILHGGNRVENRDWRHGCARRGPIWLHAAQGIGSRVDFSGTVTTIRHTLARHGVRGVDLLTAFDASCLDEPTRIANRIRGKGADLYLPHPTMPRGAIVGRANIVGTVERREDDKGVFALGTWGDEDRGHFKRALKPEEVVWWMGGFALLLEDVVALPEPVPCKGALGFWKVPADVEAKCLAQLPGAADG